MAENVGLGAGDSVFVGDRGTLEGQTDSGLQSGSGAGLAETAVHGMFLGNDDRAALARCGEDGRSIQWFDGVHAEHSGTQAASSEILRREKAVHNRFASTDERRVLAVTQSYGLADL